MNDENYPVNQPSQELTELHNLALLAKKYAKAARSHNTNRAYRSDWEDFEFWCSMKKVNCLPADPSVVATYLADRATNSWKDRSEIERPPLKVSSLARKLSAISQAHLLAGFTFNRKDNVIAETWKGIKNTRTAAQVQKEPILLEDLKQMIVKNIPDEQDEKIAIKIRDKALLLLGFAGAFRRSELVAIDIEDIKFVREGYIVTLKRSKTDQEGVGREIAIPYGSNPLTCPVRALTDWLRLAKIESGPIFRPINRHGQVSPSRLTSQAVALIIKKNPHLPGKEMGFSGHSLRSGFVTTAALKGIAEHSIMKQTGHRRSDTLKKYIRKADIWVDNPAFKIGL